MMKRKRKKWSIPTKKKIKLRELENSVFDIQDEKDPKTDSPPTEDSFPFFAGSSSPESRENHISDRRNCRSDSPPVSRRRMAPQKKYSAPIFTTSSRRSKRNRMRLIGGENATINSDRMIGKRRERVKEKKKRMAQRNQLLPNLEVGSSRARKIIQQPVIMTRIPKTTKMKESQRFHTQVEMKKMLSSRNHSFQKNNFSESRMISMFHSIDSRERENNREIMRIKLCNIHGRKIIELMNDFEDRKIQSTLSKLVIVIHSIVILYGAVSRNKSKFLNDSLVKGNYNESESVKAVKNDYGKLHHFIKGWFLKYLFRKIPEDIDDSHYCDENFRQSVGLVEDWIVNVLDEKEIEDESLLVLKDRIEKISIKISKKKF